MSDQPPTPEAAMRTQEFAAQALDEISRRALQDGHDPALLHTAFCIAGLGYIANNYGPDRARMLLQDLLQQVDTLVSRTD